MKKISTMQAFSNEILHEQKLAIGAFGAHIWRNLLCSTIDCRLPLRLAF